MFTEDDLLPISALQHLAFCPRQCALIHIEMAWAENRLTVEGKQLHERAHRDEVECRPGVRVARGLRLKSFVYGLVGVADVVEFHNGESPFPVEYKRGKGKPDNRDEVQLCAQALCLEEMLQTHISEGAIFYGQPRRRLSVIFTETLRNATITLAREFRALLESQKIPPAHYAKHCENCSLIELCMPEQTSGRKNVNAYYNAFFASIEDENQEEQA